MISVDKTAVVAEYKHNRPLTSCHWSRDGRFVFFGAEDHLVHRFDVDSQQVAALAAHDSWVRGLATAVDGQTLYTAGYDGELIFWDATAQQPEPRRRIAAHDGWVRSVVAAADGATIATCGNDRLVKVWDAVTGDLIHSFAGHSSHVYNVAFAVDSSAIYSSDHKGVTRRWSLAGGEHQELATATSLHFYDTTFRADIGGARGIAVRGDGRQLALSGITKVTNAFAGVGEVAIALLNLEQTDRTRAEEAKKEEAKKEEADKEEADGHRLLETKDKVNGTMWGVAHHPSGLWIGLSGGRGGGWIFFWKEEEATEFFKLNLKNDGRGMSMSPDGTHLAVAHADAHLRIYKIA